MWVVVVCGVVVNFVPEKLAVLVEVVKYGLRVVIGKSNVGGGTEFLVVVATVETNS